VVIAEAIRTSNDKSGIGESGLVWVQPSWLFDLRANSYSWLGEDGGHYIIDQVYGYWLLARLGLQEWALGVLGLVSTSLPCCEGSLVGCYEFSFYTGIDVGPELIVFDCVIAVAVEDPPGASPVVQYEDVGVWLITIVSFQDDVA
jgi:hypothetical protein